MKTGSGKSSRMPALDFTKGALVLIMVLYHWINYFYVGQDNRYLRFLTPSFIFISGFIISNIYLAKYDIFDSKLSIRLIQRGLKILGVFVALNATKIILGGGGSQRQDSLHHLDAGWIIETYLLGINTGNGPSKTVAFFILVPISYLLILSAVILFLSRFYRYAVHALCLIFLLCIIGMNIQGWQSPILELLTIGLLGMVAGSLPIEKVDAFVRHPIMLAIGYLLYLAAITRWNVLYPLQIIGVLLTLMLMYLVGLKRGEPSTARGWVLLLGKYSLFGYIAQIAILQLLRRGFNHFEMNPALLALSFVLAVALTIITTKILDFARAESKPIDRFYRAIFA